eukprot:maker-scaffold266_size231069-snap-gene-1.29 protein:Tk12007 transcript:maker-scaffold266_size231069-snap-gene-1.29-mRNA-1 annotation:"hypothetical protein BRAFLDRAFT_89484"
MLHRREALILAACLALACAMPQYGGNQGNPGSPQDPNEDTNGAEVPAQYDYNYEDGQQTQADEQGDEFAPAQGSSQGSSTFFGSHDQTSLGERQKRNAMPQYDQYGDNQGNLGNPQDPNEDTNGAEVPAQYDYNYEDGQQTQADEQGDEFAPAQGSSQGSSTFFGSQDQTNLGERQKRSAMPQYDQYGDNQGNLGNPQDPNEDTNGAEVPAQYDYNYEDGQQTQADEQGDEVAPAQENTQGSSTFFG